MHTKHHVHGARLKNVPTATDPPYHMVFGGLAQKNTCATTTSTTHKNLMQCTTLYSMILT